MRVSQISLGGLRVFAGAEFFPGVGLSWLTGENGAGKSSVLEALYALGHARSFRSPQFDAVLRTGEASGFIYTEWVSESLGVTRIGASKDRGGGWRYRLDGVPVARALDVASRAPMLCFEPGSHAIVGGSAERRRRLLDWGVFHVERAPAEVWSNWQRGLKQRNALLRSQDLSALGAFDQVLAGWGEQLHVARQAFSVRWLAEALHIVGWLSPNLVEVSFELRRGWGRSHGTLLDALTSQRASDLSLGFTGSGPHRADVAIRWQGAEARERLSRGQSKIIALSLVLALGQLYFERHQRWPLLLLDDLCSELDAQHAQAVLRFLRASHVQALVTGVARPDWARAEGDVLFHVERGQVTPLL